MAITRSSGGAFTATTALAAYRRVKFSAGSVVAVEYAGLGEAAIGFTATDAAIGDQVTVKFIDSDDTFKCVAAKILVGGVLLYGAANGKVSDAVSGNAIGTLMEAADADLDIVEMLPNNGAGASINGSSVLEIADGGHGVPFVITKTFADAATGDTTIYAATAPFKFRVIDAVFENRGANGSNANTVQLCAAASAASPICDALSTNGVAAKSLVRAGAIDVATAIIAAGGSLYISRVRAGGVLTGELRITAIRVA